MKKIYFFTVSILLLLTSEISAQNTKQADAVVDKLLQTMERDAFSADFTLEIKDKSMPQSQTATGHLTMKGQKFSLQSDDVSVFFDGKTQWIYMPNADEVSITEPDEKEINDINPIAVLRDFKTESTVRYINKTSSNGVYCIEMVSKDLKSDVEKVELGLNKANDNIVYINQFNRNGGTMSLRLDNLKKGIITSDKMFVFDKSKYPNVEINDLR